MRTPWRWSRSSSAGAAARSCWPTARTGAGRAARRRRQRLHQARQRRGLHGEGLPYVERDGARGGRAGGAQDRPKSRAGRDRAVSAAIKTVAAYLGNTPAVCRASYVDPRVIDRYHAGRRSARRCNRFRRASRSSPTCASASASRRPCWSCWPTPPDGGRPPPDGRPRRANARASPRGHRRRLAASEPAAALAGRGRVVELEVVIQRRLVLGREPVAVLLDVRRVFDLSPWSRQPAACRADL